nr:probable endochitinase [Crassostrea gigas]
MKSLIAILLSLVKPSYLETERFQQRPFQIIEHKQGQVCLSNTDGWYTAPTVRACASLISMEQSQTGATVFTFDSTHFICRTYIEENFNVCFFDVCSGCVSYKCSNPQDSTSTAYYPETSSVTLTAKPETTTTYTGNPETDSVTNSMVTTTTANTGTCDSHGSMSPHPSDCSKYLECVWSTVYTRDCPGGLHFNANINVCDHPASAGCQ